MHIGVLDTTLCDKVC